MVGRDGTGTATVEGEGEGLGAVTVAGHGGERVPLLDRARRECGRDGVRELVVAAGDVVALVGAAPDTEAARVGLRGDQLQEGVGGLGGGVGAVLDGVRDVQERPQVAGNPAGHTGVDPVSDGRVVERDGGGVVTVPGRGGAAGLHVVLDQLPDRLEVGVRLRARVVGAVEAQDLVGPGRGGRPDRGGGESEALAEIEDGVVGGVDQLTAVLGYLALLPEPGVGRAAAGVHPAADPGRVRLVDGGGDALVRQGEGGVEPGDPRADDGDPGHRGDVSGGDGPGGAGTRSDRDTRQADPERGRAGEQGPAGRAGRFGAGFVAEPPVLVGGEPEAVGGGVVGEQLLDLPGVVRASHVGWSFRERN